MSDNPFQIPPVTNTEPHTIAPDVTFEWLYDGQIASLSLGSLSRESVDGYMDATVALIKSHPEDQLLLFLLDVARVNGTTPHFKARLEDVKTALNETAKESRAAVVIPPGLAGQIFLFIDRVFNSRLSANASNRLFQKRDEALQWLVGALK